MHIEPDCIACIFNQALRVTKELHLDPETSKKVLDESARLLPTFDMHKTPPENATPLYRRISQLLHKPDLYAEVKRRSIEQARALLPLCERALDRSEDPFETATRIAIAGNVIDLASEIRFDLKEEFSKIFTLSFAIDDTQKLRRRLQKTRTLLYLADNAGENVFDTLYIRTLKALFPQLEVFYFVRHAPIINDITSEDLHDDPIHRYATVVDSGVDTPGIVPERLHPEARSLFDRADLILSKGMGNYECLSDTQDHRIFCLLKVKCSVVAASLKCTTGDIVCVQL